MYRSVRFALLFVTISPLYYSLRATISLRSFKTGSDFAPFRERNKNPGQFILRATEAGKPYLWLGDNESLLAQIQKEALIIALKDNIPIGFLTYHIRDMASGMASTCDSCNVIKNNATPAQKKCIAHIHLLAVLPAHRGKGIGSLLITQALQEIQQHSSFNNSPCKVGIAVHPDNKRAISLYKDKFQFSPTHQIAFGIFPIFTKNILPAPPSHVFLLIISSMILGSLFIGGLYLLWRKKS